VGKDHAANEEMSSLDASRNAMKCQDSVENASKLTTVSGAKMMASHGLMAGVLPKAQQPCPISESVEGQVNSEIEFRVEL